MDITTFPYTPREFQKEIMMEILRTLEDGTHLIMESGTGTGKTISALAPSVDFAFSHGKRVLYLTRTNSQERQVILELRAIMEKLRRDTGKTNREILHGFIPGIGLQGRRNMCPMVKVDPEFEDANSTELSRLCNRLKKVTEPAYALEEGKFSGRKGKICPFYAKTQKADLGEILGSVDREIPTAEEFITKLEEKGLCPHELNRLLLKHSLVVVAPYIYLFEPMLRNAFLEWMGVALKNLIVIVDEAHNLPDFTRELVSEKLSLISIDRAIEEAENYGREKPLLIAENLKVIDFARELQDIIRELAEEYVIDDDGLVPPYWLEEELMHRFKFTSNRLKQAIGNLINHGLAIQDERLNNHQLPRSYIHSLGSFLLWWMELAGEKFVKLINGGENPSLEYYCMDPVDVIEVVKWSHASVHLSGTLRPLEQYRAVTGLPRDTALRIFPSPFPEENLSVLYLSDVTTRYEDLDSRMISRLANATSDICNSTDRNIMVFFPSFNLLEKFLDTGISLSLNRRLFIEEQGLTQSELMGRLGEFRESGGVFFAVVGGRMSEGLDFPAELLEIVIIEGIPYPKPTAKQRALQHYYEILFGRGWEFTVKAPTTRKLLQSIGRIIRTEKDRGVAVIMDRRAVHFNEDIPQLRESNDPILDIKEFFGD